MLAKFTPGTPAITRTEVIEVSPATAPTVTLTLTLADALWLRGLTGITMSLLGHGPYRALRDALESAGMPFFTGREHLPVSSLDDARLAAACTKAAADFISNTDEG